METICNDLKAEHEELEGVLAGLDENQWEMKTPFLNWRIKDEIRHLAYFDDRAALAATRPDAFNQHLEEVLNDFEAFEKTLETVGLDMSPVELMQWWREQRKIMLEALAKCSPKDRLPWYVRPWARFPLPQPALWKPGHTARMFSTPCASGEPQRIGCATSPTWGSGHLAGHMPTAAWRSQKNRSGWR